ncbi:MAG: phosphoglycolate phosphatase [Firmicutes bacterium]|nr:phosphoglycolate phosphatase [Bacillota bacterium]
MPFSVVLFDLDGTLIDTNHLIVSSFQHTFREKLGREVDAEEIHQYFGEPLITTMERYSQERAGELTDFYRTFNVANHDFLIRQFDGVLEALTALKAADIKLGIVTSKFHEMARRGLRVSRLEEFFDTVVGMDETEQHKPDAEPALLALRRLGVAPGHDVLMVGDSRFDILCGKNAGLKTAAVAWSVTGRESLTGSGPDFWIQRPADLVPLVLGK